MTLYGYESEETYVLPLTTSRLAVVSRSVPFYPDPLALPGQAGLYMPHPTNQ